MTERFTARDVQRVTALPRGALARLLDFYGLRITLCKPGNPIPGSYWGEPEAGLIGCGLYVRNDTPVHSALHEACHFICMPPCRRGILHTDAGGDDAEENAVCYLQIILAQQLTGTNSQRIMRDMDAWGYSFRLGSAEQWFQNDADDARKWLCDRALLPIHSLIASIA